MIDGKMFSEDTLLQFINSELHISTNPTEFEYNGQFEQFMDDPAIMSFGRWMQANGQALAAFTMEDGIRHKIPYLVIGRDI